ncbi:hypothetical protein HaLaN_17058, partial [Haematococcus lacustris]
MGNRAVHMRHPEDIVHVMRTHADRYCKGAEQLVGGQALGEKGKEKENYQGEKELREGRGRELKGRGGETSRCRSQDTLQCSSPLRMVLLPNLVDWSSK